MVRAEDDERPLELPGIAEMRDEVANTLVDVAAHRRIVPADVLQALRIQVRPVRRRERGVAVPRTHSPRYIERRMRAGEVDLQEPRQPRVGRPQQVEPIARHPVVPVVLVAERTHVSGMPAAVLHVVDIRRGLPSLFQIGKKRARGTLQVRVHPVDLPLAIHTVGESPLQ